MPVIRAKRARHFDEVSVNRAHPSDRAHQNGKDGGQKDDRHLGGQINAKPDHDERNQRNARGGIKRRDKGIKHGIDALVPAHHYAQRNANDHRKSVAERKF